MWEREKHRHLRILDKNVYGTILLADKFFIPAPSGDSPKLGNCLQLHCQANDGTMYFQKALTFLCWYEKKIHSSIKIF